MPITSTHYNFISILYDIFLLNFLLLFIIEEFASRTCVRNFFHIFLTCASDQGYVIGHKCVPMLCYLQHEINLNFIGTGENDSHLSINKISQLHSYPLFLT